MPSQAAYVCAQAACVKPGGGGKACTLYLSQHACAHMLGPGEHGCFTAAARLLHGCCTAAAPAATVLLEGMCTFQVCAACAAAAH